MNAPIAIVGGTLVDGRGGMLEKGKLADIAAIEGDPLRDISRLRNLRLVVRNGIAIDPEDIQYLEI